MDKLKNILHQIKKYHFWMLCLVVMIVGFYAWYSSAALLDSEKKTNIGEIGKHKSDVEAISRMPEHPNDQVLAGIEAQTKNLQSEVFRVWSDLYQRQREEVLKWPSQLTDEFISHVDAGKFGDTIPVDLREQYQDTIKERLKQLREIVHAKEPSRDEDDELLPGDEPVKTAVAKTQAEDEDFIVVWDNEDDIRKIIDWEETPSDLKVWVAQEDLWVYEQLLNIIRETNKRATGPHDANVTRIHAIQAGSSAALRSGGGNRIFVDDSAGGDDEGVDSEESLAPSPSEDLSEEEIELLDGRYLNGEGKPIRAGQELDVKEYKRMPVRFDLRMDQREISQLIVNCSNATLPVEVRQVRINPKDRFARRPSFQKGPKFALNDSEGRKEAMVRVEIHGIIYIFNPPDSERLEIEPNAPEQPVEPPSGEEGSPETSDPEQPGEAAEKAEAPSAEQPPAGEETPEKPAEEPTQEPAAEIDDASGGPSKEPAIKPETSPEITDTPEGS